MPAAQANAPEEQDTLECEAWGYQSPYSDDHSEGGLVFHWGPRSQEGSEQHEPEPEEEYPEPAQELAAQQPYTGTMMGGGEGIPLISDEPIRTPAIGTSGGGVEHESEESGETTSAQEPGEDGGEQDDDSTTVSSCSNDPSTSKRSCSTFHQQNVQKTKENKRREI